MDDRISVQSYLRMQKERHPEDVCRCLFGPTDKDLNRQFVQQQQKIHIKNMSEKWDFDFENEMPMPPRRDGNLDKYMWQKVQEDDCENIPEAYSLPQLTKSAMLCNMDTIGGDVEHHLLRNREVPTDVLDDCNKTSDSIIGQNKENINCSTNSSEDPEVSSTSRTDRARDLGRKRQAIITGMHY